MQKRYFERQKQGIPLVIKAFLIILFVFYVVFFLFGIMRYNKIMEEKAEREAELMRLSDEVDRLKYLVDAPLDDAYKIRIAREKLGMCFPDEIIFHTEIE